MIVWRKLSICNKIFFAFGTLIILSMAAVFLYSHNIVLQELNRQMTETSERSMYVTAEKIDAIFSQSASQSRLLSYNATLKNALDGYEAKSTLDKWIAWSALDKMLEAWIQSDQIADIRLHLPQSMLFLRDGQRYIANWALPNSLSRNRGASEILWYLAPDFNTYSVFIPVFIDFQTVAYIEVIHDASMISDLLLSQDRAGVHMWLASRTEDVHPENEAGSRQTVESVQNQREQIELAGAPFVLAGKISVATISPEGKRMLTRLWMMMASVLICAFILARRISISITRRISTLKDAIDTISTGNLSVIVPNQDGDEMDRIINRFGDMTKTLKSALDDSRRMEKAQRESELRLLQSQINPHFINNTLSAISWAATRKDEKQIHILTESLSGFLRLSLTKTQQPSALSKELSMVRFYWKVQAYRFVGRLSLMMDIQPEAMQAVILPMIVQPLVENALLHGILCADHRKGTVMIRASILETLLIIKVEDDGVGMTPETLFHLQEKMNDPVDGSYGLWNVHQRVIAYAGDDYGLSIRSERGKGTCCQLTLPYKTLP